MPPQSTKLQTQVQPRKSLTPWLILALLVLAVLAPFLLVQGGEDIITWRTDLDAAMAEAKAKNKPVLIDFTAEWCPPCKVMKRQVFSQPQVKHFIEANYIPLQLDFTQKNATTAELSRRFSIRYLPTFLVLSPAGEELRRESGGMNEADFLTWLKVDR